MAAWAQLRQRLLELETEDGPLLGYPDPRADDQEAPHHIHLAAWAVAEAKALHREFGADVVLTWVHSAIRTRRPNRPGGPPSRRRCSIRTRRPSHSTGRPAWRPGTR